MRVMKLSLAMLAIVVLLVGACGDSSGPGGTGTAGSSGGSSAGRGGTTGAAGTMGAAGTTGNAGTSGSAGRGGTTGAAGGGGATGTQPIGAACANTSNCSQADGTAVCCLSIPACVLADQCPGSPTYVSCETTPCSKAGWICCNAGGMHFCTKQSGCPSP